MTATLDQFRPSLMHRWDVGTLAWVVWDGSLTTASVTIGKVDQGVPGASAWPISLNVPTAVVNGKTTVATAGTRVALATTTTVKSVTIKALRGNTGSIYVGNSSVAAANGFELRASEAVSLDVADLATVNLDSSVNGEGVTYVGVV